jgi:periplasmic divalent cation tolerance protein
MVITTVPNREAAENLAESILNDRLAACVQMADIRSFFIWEGKLQKEGEVALHIKTTEARYHELEAHILEHHPYEVPEIIMLPITAGLPAYLGWIDAATALGNSSKS